MASHNLLDHGRLLRTSTRLPESPSETQLEGDDGPPKYLTLRRSKPLLGWEQAQGSASVIVVEGVFDFLTLRSWGYPAVALLGTHTRPDLVEQLRTFRRVYLALDRDEGGAPATLKLMDVLGPAAVPVELPDGTKDVAELALAPTGRSGSRPRSSKPSA